MCFLAVNARCPLVSVLPLHRGGAWLQVPSAKQWLSLAPIMTYLSHNKAARFLPPQAGPEQGIRDVSGNISPFVTSEVENTLDRSIGSPHGEWPQRHGDRTWRDCNRGWNNYWRPLAAEYKGNYRRKRVLEILKTCFWSKILNLVAASGYFLVLLAWNKIKRNEVEPVLSVCCSHSALFPVKTK